MKKDNIILGVLMGATAIVLLYTNRLKVEDAYIKGRTDQLTEDTEALELLTKQLKALTEES